MNFTSAVILLIINDFHLNFKIINTNDTNVSRHKNSVYKLSI